MTVWTSPKTWSVAEKVTAALMNTHLRDNALYLFEVISGTNAVKVALAAMASTVPSLSRRQGSSATDWFGDGTTNYNVGAAFMQAGSTRVTIGIGAVSNTVTITFPTAFSTTPLVFVTTRDSSGILVSAAYVSNPTTTTVITVQRQNGVSTGAAISPWVDWLAIGTP